MKNANSRRCAPATAFTGANYAALFSRATNLQAVAPICREAALCDGELLSHRSKPIVILPPRNHNLPRVFMT